MNKNYCQNAYYPELPPTGPHSSILARPESDITSKNHLKPKKKRDPGPGHYPDKDVQFKKPVTKFAKDGRKEPGTRNNFPAPDVYNPRMVQTEKNFWKFPSHERFKDERRGFVTPGPGMYETQKMNPGLAKGIGGGKIGPSEVLDNGVPGPGTYFEKGMPKAKSVPGFKIKPASYIKQEKKGKGEPVGP